MVLVSIEPGMQLARYITCKSTCTKDIGSTLPESQGKASMWVRTSASVRTGD